MEQYALAAKRANLLLANGADVNATNQGGRSVLDLALQVDAKPGPLSHGNTLHQFVAPEDWAPHYTTLRAMLESLGDTPPRIDPEIAKAFLDRHTKPELTPLAREAMRKNRDGETPTAEEQAALMAFMDVSVPTSPKYKVLAPIMKSGLTEDGAWVLNFLNSSTKF